MDEVKLLPCEELVETIARALCEANFAQKGCEGEFGSVDDCWFAWKDAAIEAIEATRPTLVTGRHQYTRLSGEPHPIVPRWVIEAKIERMAVHPVLLNSVAFVGIPTERLGFRALGSCFFIAMDAGEGMVAVYVVTCRHLVSQDRSTYLRISKKDAAPVQIEINASEWLFPTDPLVDLAVAPFDTQRWDKEGQLFYAPVWAPEALWSGPIPDFMLTTGDDLWVPSLFAPHPGELRNIAVMRRATIAALPEEPLRYASPKHPSYLIETRSLGGASGSPVFVDLAPFSGLVPWVMLKPTGKYDLPVLLLGMLLKSHAGDYRDDFAQLEGVEFADAQFNAGISVVMPIEIVSDFLQAPEVAASRIAAVEMDKARVGYFHPIGSTRTGGPRKPGPGEKGPFRVTTST